MASRRNGAWGPGAGSWLVAAITLLLPSAAQADASDTGRQASGAVVGGKPMARLELLSSARTVAPGGRFRVGVLFRMEPGWHIYWRNAGQSGLPPKIDWSAANLRFGPLQWPAPETFRQGTKTQLTTYGYSKEVLLFTDALLAPGATGTISLDAKVDYLVCKIDCVPGKAMLRIQLPVRPRTEAADAATVGRFDASQKRVPLAPENTDLSLTVALSQSAVRPGDRFRVAVGIACQDPKSGACPPLRVPAGGARDAFIPDQMPGLEVEAASARAHPLVRDALVVELEGKAGPDELKGALTLAGLLSLRRADGRPLHVMLSTPIPSAPAGAAIEARTSPLLGARPSQEVPLWEALLLALLGGLILNVMPCVFPVLAIKVRSFAQVVQEEKASVRSHAFAYLAGIVASMWLLAGIIIALRAAGVGVSWGLQFQEPVFVAVMAGVMVLFALNLFGVFYLSLPAAALARKTTASSGHARSFWEGVLAVALATPCSAPMLSTAVGVAFASPPAVIVAIFTAIGVGLAAPFMILVQLPGLTRRLPRAGAWMERIKTLLGFALIGTAIWLLWVFGRLTSLNDMTALLILLAALAFAAWLYGISQAQTRRRQLLSLVAGILVVTAAGYLSLREGTRLFRWQPFTPGAVEATLKSGKVAFVDFTADWCATCKLNKWNAIESASVQRAVQANGVVMFQADFTKRDESIRKILERYGRASVPLYVVHSPHRPDAPKVLPDLLSTETVVKALEAAAAR